MVKALNPLQAVVLGWLAIGRAVRAHTTMHDY
jgi:hypothetical protein